MSEDTKMALAKKQQELNEALEMEVFWGREVKKLQDEADQLILALPQPSKQDEMKDYLDAVDRNYQRKREASKAGRPVLSPIDQARKNAMRKPRAML